MFKNKKLLLVQLLAMVLLVISVLSFENSKELDLDNTPYEEWPGYSNVL